MYKIIPTKFNREAIQYLKGILKVERPCGAPMYIKIRRVIEIKKRIVELRDTPYDIFVKKKLNVFYFSDGDVVAEHTFLNSYQDITYRCSYLTHYGNTVPSTVWTDEDFEYFLRSKKK